MRSIQLCVVVLAVVSSVMGSSQYSGSGRWNSGGSHDSSAQNHDDGSSSSNGTGNSSSSSSSASSSSSYGVNASSSSFIQRHHILIAHAVLACVAWAFLFPIGAIFLRLNINHPILLKLHIFTQILAYCVYVAGAGLGIWLALRSQAYYDVWSDPHPIIGLVLLALATVQPFTGWIHHRIYRSRALTLATTKRGPRPGRTLYGYIHLWFGRALITLGIVNGGLGLKLLEGSPVQDSRFTRNAQIGYGIGAGLMWCIYVAFTVVAELARSLRNRDQAVDGSPRTSRRGKAESSLSSSSSTTNEDVSLRQMPKLPA